MVMAYCSSSRQLFWLYKEKCVCVKSSLVRTRLYGVVTITLTSLPLPSNPNLQLMCVWYPHNTPIIIDTLSLSSLGCVELLLLPPHLAEGLVASFVSQ